VAEEMPMADGRRDAATLAGQVSTLHPGALLFDMQAAAREAGTVVSAVMFCAIAATGVLALPRAACEDIVRGSGRGVEASLAGFAAGFAAVSASGSAGSHGATRAVSAIAPPVMQVRGVDLPAPVAEIARLGADRIADFQDDELAADYLGRVAAWIELERISGAAAGHAASAAAARALALWMPYQDVIRVADLKSRPERFAQVRADVDAAPDEPVLVRAYRRPRIAEIADILPPRLAERLTDWAERRGRVGLSKGIRLPTSRALGLLAMRALASLRPSRRRSSRFAREMALVRRWDAA